MAAAQKLSVIPALIALQACAHQVFSLDVEAPKIAAVRATLAADCAEGDCGLGDCWYETATLVVCKVDVAYQTGDAKQELLGRTRSRLADAGIQVGFCAHDSPGSRLASTMVCSFVAGALSGGHGHGSCVRDQVEAVGPKEPLAIACASSPVAAPPPAALVRSEPLPAAGRRLFRHRSILDSLN